MPRPVADPAPPPTDADARASSDNWWQEGPSAAVDRSDLWDRAVEWLLIGLLAFAPLALGAVEAWSEMAVVGFAAALSVCLLLKLILRPGSRFRWSWAYVAISLFLLLACLQLQPLPAWLLQRVSPNTLKVKGELLADLPADAAASGPAGTTLSFYTAGTHHDLRLVLAAAAVFVVVLNIYRRPAQMKRLLTAITVIGAVAAALALAQDLSRASRIYWLIATPAVRADAGPFINHSHFAQFINLSIGAALGLLLVNLRQAARRIGDDSGGISLAAAVQGGPLNALAVLWPAGVIVLDLAALALSMSRGGMIAALVAAAFTSAMLAIMGRRRAGSAGGSAGGSLVVLLGLAAFLVVLYLGFDALYDRFASHDLDAGRWQMLKDVTVLWRMFPALGSGLGTHQYVFPLVDRSILPNVASHAENEYAQLLEETGVVGLTIVVMFIALVWVSYARAIRGVRSLHAAAFGLGFGLCAVLLHSFSDFGQHLPANACLTAITCGLLIALARFDRERRNAAGHPQAISHRKAAADTSAARASGGGGRAFAPGGLLLTRRAGIAAVAALVAGLLFTLPRADAARKAAAHWARAAQVEAALRQNGWSGTDDDYSELIAEAESASARSPDDIRYRFGLSFYRWQSIVRDGEFGQAAQEPDSVTYAARIVDELHAARRICPTFGGVYTLAGKLEAAVLRQPQGAAHIRTGHRLSPFDPEAALLAGWLEGWEGNWDASLAALRRAVRLDGNMQTRATDIYLRELGRPDLALELAGSEPDALFRLAGEIESAGPDAAAALPIAAAARERGIAGLRALCDAPNAPAGSLGALAEIYRNRGDHSAAIEYYRRAISHDYGEVAWHLGLARSLAAAGLGDDAVNEARICLRLRPGMAEAHQIIAQNERKDAGR